MLTKLAFLRTPPHSAIVGRRDGKDIAVYREQATRKLCNLSKQRLSENVYISLFRGLSLVQYILARNTDCHNRHMQPCCKCSAMLSVAAHVVKEGYCMLAEGFKSAFPGQKYKTDIAIARLLQMPLAVIRVGAPEGGRAAWFLIEYAEGVDYINFSHFCQALFRADSPSPTSSLDKKAIKGLLSLARSDRERELIRYTAFKSSGMTSTAARHRFGFENMKERVERVEDCIEAARKIREVINELSQVQDEAVLIALGLKDMPLESEIDSESADEEIIQPPHSIVTGLPEFDVLTKTLQDGQYNWFVLADFLQELGFADTQAEKHLNTFYEHVKDTSLDPGQKLALTTSYAAFRASTPDASQQRSACALNGDIVTDSESDDAEDYANIHSLASEHAKRIITKKRKSLLRRARRLKAKHIAEQNFLCRKSKHMKSVVDRFPDIGQSIESFVSESNIGADAWRRTGVLTFDGNLRIKQKVTYGRIRQHLEEKYNCKFSYGTVVQLCIARNKRRRSAANYKGIAQVTTRRARKGFCWKYNPDKHWSGALYRGLNLIQYTDGTDITNINRDDASGFRLDTLTTHCKHATPTVAGKEVVTTHTDYVNRYPSILQTTSYNFTASKTTEEKCAGIVKAARIFPKNPMQHYADIEMLNDSEQLKSAFLNPLTRQSKRIDCIRVDGASDEGPSHEEVRFWWAARHLARGKLVTLVSSRSSGSSYLNRVELQNGCLALGHANLFIPSTLGGSVINPDSGAVDMERVAKNLDLATSVYIDRVNGCPCGGTVIHLYRGADSSNLQKNREHLMVYLKGTKKKKQKLAADEPELYAYFTSISEIRQRHEVKGLPPQYLYMLVCCFQPSCPHPLCRAGKEGVPDVWFEGGPQLNVIPLPIPDPNRMWGNNACSTCSDFCAGHFLTPEESLKSNLTPMVQPPSSILKEVYEECGATELTEVQVQDLAKLTLLPVSEVIMWLEHLKTVHTNRKRGAAKAAQTRRQKRQGRENQQVSTATTTSTHVEEFQTVYCCGVCGTVYGDSDESEYWIGCEKCDSWYHGACVSITPDNEPEIFFCSLCT